jgi:hypothetical protein
VQGNRCGRCKSTSFEAQSSNTSSTAAAPRPHVGCLLKGTKISTPSVYRPAQELQIGDEVHTLAGRKAIKWIGYSKFTKEEGKVWRDSVMPIRAARFAIDYHSPHTDLYLSPLLQRVRTFRAFADRSQ